MLDARVLDTRVLDQIAIESRAAHERATEQRLLSAVGEALAQPFATRDPYAVPGAALNRVVRDLMRAAAELDAAGQYLAQRGRETFGAQCTAHATRLRQTRDLLVAHATHPLPIAQALPHEEVA